MHICVFSPDYPTSRTIDFVFVEQLCRALVRKGHTITVIAPQTLTKCMIRHVPVAKLKEKVFVEGDRYYTLIRPKYFSVGNLKGILKKHNMKAFKKAAKRGFKYVSGKVDVIYGHFWQSVSAAMPIAKAHNLPLVASSGEEFISKKRFGNSEKGIAALRDYVCGTIHVSSNNRDECKATGLVKDDACIVIPNAIDNKLFYPRDRQQCRAKLNIASDDFVVAFVGQFTPRKGTLRLDEALRQLNDKHIKAFFLGKGPDVPSYDSLLHCGTVMHDDIPTYLSAADVFVLPTTNEGCCNAIVEAMACGLPVISSNLPFNFDILDDTNSIMVDPMDVDQIAQAIAKLKNDPDLRKRLAQGALVKAEGLTLDRRADRILEFIQKQIQ